MADPTQLSVVQQDAKAWNEWRIEHETPVDLKDSDLAGKNLSSADLHSADLKGANLRKCDLSNADLSQADLTGADLQEATLAATNLFETRLREASLQGADLSGAIGGIRTEQLAGADLTGAKLPDQLKKLYDGLDNVKGISESARKLFLAVLAACLYCWLTIVTTTDANLITNRNSSPLPIIQTSIPIVGFYVVAPLLVLCVYFYLHFYLQKLWEELGSLPAIFQDGRPLHTKVDPWLLNDLVRSHLPKLSVDRPFLSYLQLWISVLLAWWIVPITMLLFWMRYLRRHEPIGTAFHVALLLISIVAAVRLYQLAVATLVGTERKPFAWKSLLISRRSHITAAFACAAGILFGLISVGVFLGIRSDAPIFGHTPKSEDEFRENGPHQAGLPFYGPQSWVPRWMAFFGYPPYANLESADVSQKGAAWTGEKQNDEDLDHVVGGQLSGTHLRYASAERAFLANADLKDADLTGANFANADLRHADLGGADLSHASVMEANLRGAKLDNAILFETDLAFADLRGARLNGCDLIGADLLRTDLRGADLQQVDMNNALLTQANLSGVDLGRVQLEHATLSYANLTSTRNLDPEKLKHASHWEQAFYDDQTVKTLGLPPDHNQQLVQQYFKENPYDTAADLPWPNPPAPQKQP